MIGHTAITFTADNNIELTTLFKKTLIKIENGINIIS